MNSDLIVDSDISGRSGFRTPVVGDSSENDGLQKLVVDLLLKNQLLRETVNARDETLMQITRIVTPRATRDCNCHAEKQMARIDRLLRIEI